MGSLVIVVIIIVRNYEPFSKVYSGRNIVTMKTKIRTPIQIDQIGYVQNGIDVQQDNTFMQMSWSLSTNSFSQPVFVSLKISNRVNCLTMWCEVH